MNTARLLTYLLRLGGALLCTAALATLLPIDWMAAIHAALGLGAMPRTALVEYLTRSIAALYAVHGGVMLVAASDVRRMDPLIRYLGWANVAFGAAILIIDLSAGMPWFWTAAEGPPVMGVGMVILLLRRKIHRLPE